MIAPINDKKEEPGVDDESEYLLDEYDSHNEAKKDGPGPSKSAIGGSNISPEVLKMIQQMAPHPSAEKEEDEPDDIKVAISRNYI